VRLAADSYEVEGEIDIATLNRLFHGVFDDIEEERLAGFIHERLGRLPEPGDVIRVDGVEIVVRRMDDNKLEKVLVRRVPDETGAA
jgi:putative hemolysin